MNIKDKIDMFCMDELEKEEIEKFAEKIVEIFDNNRNNLKNAKVELIVLLRE